MSGFEVDEGSSGRKGGDGGKGADGGKDGGKGSKRSGASSTPYACVMKCLTPEVLASAIIGKGGQVVAQMRQSCQARIGLTDHGDFYPNTDCRVLTAQAPEKDSLIEVVRQILGKTAEVAKLQSSEAIGEEGQLKFRILVPKAAVGGIIGKGGASIKQIRETSGAKINISASNDSIGQGPSAEQMVSLQGTKEALQQVLNEVNSQVQQLSGETWFSTWVSGANLVPVMSNQGYGAGGYGAAQAMQPMARGYGAGGYGAAPMMAPMGRGGFTAPGVDTMMNVAQTLPQYVMEDSRGFALSCVVPNKLVGGLIGRGGSGTREVQAKTGTKIQIREIHGDPENRSMNITGPLASTCAAYMLMMKRYLDAEAGMPAES